MGGAGVKKFNDILQSTDLPVVKDISNWKFHSIDSEIERYQCTKFLNWIGIFIDPNLPQQFTKEDFVNEYLRCFGKCKCLEKALE